MCYLGFLCVCSGRRLACNLPFSYYICLVVLAKLCQLHEVLWEIAFFFLFFERLCIDENNLLLYCLVELTCKLGLVFSLWEDFKLLIISLKFANSDCFLVGLILIFFNFLLAIKDIRKLLLFGVFQSKLDPSFKITTSI